MADVRLVVGLGLLLAVTVGTLTLLRVPGRRGLLVAVARGAVQLAVVGAALRGVFAAPWTTALVLTVMLATATWTAARRLRDLPAPGPVLLCVLAATAAGAAVTLGIAFAVPVLARSPRYLVALGGSTIGGTMTGASLAGRHLLAALRSRREEVEGWLALGATPRQAVADLARTAVAEALVPAIDQTRTVGLVTLPGAYIGSLLGGASPAAAARFQLVVLVGLLAAETVAAAVLILLVGAPRVLPEPPAAR